MTTKTNIKTTVTLTFSFISCDEKSAIRKLLNWMSEYQDDRPEVVRDCESGHYTITDKHVIAGDHIISNSFKFDNVAELAQKYGTHFSAYDITRAVLDYGNRESVTAKSETIEVEDN